MERNPRFQRIVRNPRVQNVPQRLVGEQAVVVKFGKEFIFPDEELIKIACHEPYRGRNNQARSGCGYQLYVDHFLQQLDFAEFFPEMLQTIGSLGQRGRGRHQRAIQRPDAGPGDGVQLYVFLSQSAHDPGLVGPSCAAPGKGQSQFHYLSSSMRGKRSRQMASTRRPGAQSRGMSSGMPCFCRVSS